MKKIFLTTLIFAFCFKISAQEKLQLPTDNENNIYWQPDVTINFSDYQSPTDTTCVKFDKKYGMKSAASVGFRGIVDVPKRRKKGKYDKSYFAPVFCKNCSCILSEDSLTLKVDKLCFDIAEISARCARRELLKLQKDMHADNTNAMFFTSVKNKWDKFMQDFFSAMIRDILIDRKENAYESWKNMIDSMLIENKQFATTPEDCYRFVLNQPIIKGYIRAKSIMGDLYTRKDEKENNIIEEKK